VVDELSTVFRADLPDLASWRPEIARWRMKFHDGFENIPQQNYEDTPNIGVEVFMRVTQRLLERNGDIFKPIMEFHSPSGYFWSPCS
jgi:hypothetical protein